MELSPALKTNVAELNKRRKRWERWSQVWLRRSELIFVRSISVSIFFWLSSDAGTTAQRQMNIEWLRWKRSNVEGEFGKGRHLQEQHKWGLNSMSLRWWPRRETIGAAKKRQKSAMRQIVDVEVLRAWNNLGHKPPQSQPQTQPQPQPQPQPPQSQAEMLGNHDHLTMAKSKKKFFC